MNATVIAVPVLIGVLGYMIAVGIHGKKPRPSARGIAVRTILLMIAVTVVSLPILGRLNLMFMPDDTLSDPVQIIGPIIYHLGAGAFLAVVTGICTGTAFMIRMLAK